MELGTVHSSAGSRLSLLSAHKGSASYNPEWGRTFWTAVAQLEARSPFDPAVRGTLMAHGYFGQGTISPPRDTLAAELQQLRDGGAPLGGSIQGLLGSSTSQMVATEGRWEDGLPPDIRRAAPEIYRSLRSQGSATVREWLSANFSGSKQSSTWLDLWNLATEVDYALS